MCVFVCLHEWFAQSSSSPSLPPTPCLTDCDVSPHAMFLQVTRCDSDRDQFRRRMFGTIAKTENLWKHTEGLSVHVHSGRLGLTGFDISPGVDGNASPTYLLLRFGLAQALRSLSSSHVGVAVKKQRKITF